MLGYLHATASLAAPQKLELVVWQLLSQHSILQVRQASFLLDITPSDFLCSIKVKQSWKGKQFDYVERTECYAAEHLLMISKTEFEICFKHGQNTLEPVWYVLKEHIVIEFSLPSP